MPESLSNLIPTSTEINETVSTRKFESGINMSDATVVASLTAGTACSNAIVNSTADMSIVNQSPQESISSVLTPSTSSSYGLNSNGLPQTLDHWSATLLAAQALVRTKKVFIGGVASGTTAEELEAFFSEFGKVSSFLK
ncbi:Rna-binding protein musashi [Fasciolopsis buskii]|uniref:Rna-binding protein musashi n=1 Tax=Fasciolopsis buskii TaxID=27845 RepID=A0A8E0VGF7_9TREM|nr:Rna-binding protein musashi [Fasciolopsis buski]